MYVAALIVSSLVLTLISKQQHLRENMSSIAKCKSNIDCSLNGICTLGKCICDKPWQGEFCGQLHFRPISASGQDIYPVSEANESWGGTTIKAAGKFYAFVSVYPPHNLWGSNARIGVADKIEGPYMYNQSLPMLTGGGHLITVPYVDTNGVNRFTIWSNPYHVYDFARDDPTVFRTVPLGAHLGGDAVFWQNGTWYGLNGNRIMSASHYLGPWKVFSTFTHDSWGSNVTAEDVFFWRDIRGNFHMFYHLYNTHEYTKCNSSIVSGHSFSLPDGKSFVTKHIQPYGHEFKLEDGSTKVHPSYHTTPTWTDQHAHTCSTLH